MKSVRYNKKMVLIIYDRTTGSGARLADYLETLSEGRIEPTAVQWNRLSQVGTITCNCTPDNEPELKRLLADYQCPKA